MKKIIIAIFFATSLVLTSAQAYNYNNNNFSNLYNNSSNGYNYSYNSYNNYNNGYNSNYNSQKYSNQRICGFNGYSFKTFENGSYLDRDNRYDYAYTGRCISSKNSSYKRNHDLGNYNRYNATPIYTVRNVSSPNKHSCATYNMRTLVPQCHYKYSTDKYGCTRPVIHCDYYTRDKFLDNSNYSFTSYGITNDVNKCPTFKLSAAVNGCSYEYVKNEDGCNVPKLVCGTKNTNISGILKSKADRELNAKYSQVENMYLNNSSRIIALKNLKLKLEKQIATASSSDEALIKYMIASVEEKIEEYERSGGVTPIFDILY